MRINRSGAVGVSMSTWILSAFVGELWIAYGFSFRVPSEIYANVTFLLVALYVVLVAARSQNVLRRSSVTCLGATALAVGISLFGTSHHWRWILATFAVGGAVVIYLPQMMMTLRSKELEGVSVVSWALALVTGLAWALYGVLIHQTAVCAASRRDDPDNSRDLGASHSPSSARTSSRRITRACRRIDCAHEPPTCVVPRSWPAALKSFDQLGTSRFAKPSSVPNEVSSAREVGVDLGVHHVGEVLDL